MFQLVVVRPFGTYSLGDVITDAHTIQTIISSEHANHVVRIHKLGEG